MKLRILAARNASAVLRYPQIPVPEETDAEDNTTPLEQGAQQSEASGELPTDTGNRLPTGGRSGNVKIDKFQGYKIPPMY